MGGETQDSEINHMISQLKNRIEENQATVLVLGSRTGGLFRSDELYETLQCYGDPSFAGLSRTAQFGACYRILTHPDRFMRYEINQLFTRILANIPISEADIYLAALVKLRMFDVIISTNIDSTFEKAMQYVGMKDGSDFSVYDQRNVADANSPRKKHYCKVIKVFGQIAEKEYTVKRNSYLDQHKDIEHLLGNELGRDILAIGLDNAWDEEIYRAFRPQGDTFWYVNEERLPESSALYTRTRARNVQQFIGEERNYEDFINSLYWQYVEAMPANFVLHGIVLHEVRQLREKIGKYDSMVYEIRQLQEEMRKLREEIRNYFSPQEPL